MPSDGSYMEKSCNAVKQVFLTQCKFSQISGERSCIVKISASQCSFDCGFYCKSIF